MVNFKQLDQVILGEIWNSSTLEDCMHYLCDECNGRFAGSEDDYRATEYMLKWYQKYGLENVRFEPFQMLSWERGDTFLEVIYTDGRKPQLVPSAGMAVSPDGMVEADVIDAGVGTPEDVEKLGDAIKGKIVLVNHEGPHRSVKYAAAVAAGAVGFIISNGVPGGHPPVGSLPLHTERPTIPGLGVSLETGAYLRRRLGEGTLRVKITAKCKQKSVTARNVIAELPGTDPKAGWIVIGGHCDGHDVAQGAIDNGTGTAVVLETARLLAPLRSNLKAGVRFVNFTGEELGLNGSFAYVNDFPGEIDSIRAVFNIDIIGMYPPVVLMLQGAPQLKEYFKAFSESELDFVVKDEHFVPYSDHFAFMLKGIETLMAVSSMQPGAHGWVHTSADTLDKIEFRFLRQAVATTARLILRMAAAPEGLPTTHKSVAETQEIIRKGGFEDTLKRQGLFPA